MPQSQENLLLSAFNQALTDNTTRTIKNLLEVGLDQLANNEIIKSFPFISTVISVYNIGDTLRERHHLKSIAIFMQEIGEGVFDEDKRKKYVQKLSENKGFRNQELEYILILLDKYINYDKSKWLAKLYLAYLNEEINWDEFLVYSEIIDNFLFGDEIFLLHGHAPNNIPTAEYEKYVERFCFMGLLEHEYHNEPVPNISGKPIPIKIDLGFKGTRFGIKLFRIIFNDPNKSNSL